MSLDEERAKRARAVGADPEDKEARDAVRREERRTKRSKGVPPCPLCGSIEYMVAPDNVAIPPVRHHKKRPSYTYGDAGRFHVVPYRCSMCGCVAWGSFEALKEGGVVEARPRRPEGITSLPSEIARDIEEALAIPGLLPGVPASPQTRPEDAPPIDVAAARAAQYRTT